MSDKESKPPIFTRTFQSCFCARKTLFQQTEVYPGFVKFVSNISRQWQKYSSKDSERNLRSNPNQMNDQESKAQIVKIIFPSCFWPRMGLVSTNRGLSLYFHVLLNSVDARK